MDPSREHRLAACLISNLLSRDTGSKSNLFSGHADIGDTQ
eukprot:COSAG02_NODE_58219_length_278_cov_0.575419_1_plen_39_part_10